MLFFTFLVSQILTIRKCVKSNDNFCTSNNTFNHFLWRYYKQHKISSKVKTEYLFKVAYQQPTQQSPPTTTSQESPKTPTSSQTNHPQSSIRIPFQENPFTFEEKKSIVIRTFNTRSSPRTSKRPTIQTNIQYKTSLHQDLNRTRYPSKKLN